MTKSTLRVVCLGIILVALYATNASAQRRRAVVVHPVRHPVARTHLALRPGHPIHRVLPANVAVRAPRRAVIVNHPFVYLPLLSWRARVVTLPPTERLVWQESESIARDEEWVDTNYGVDGVGNTLVLNIDGKTKLNFAEVAFDDGKVQVVDFTEGTYGPGTFTLLDLPGGRHVATVRILAKSETDDTKLAVYLSK
jgi:hypothetical protein